MWIYSKNPDQVIWLAENLKWVWHLNLFSRTRVNTLKKPMFWIFVGIASLRQFQQISKTYVYEETTTKQNLSYMSIYLLSILYSSKFILMATNCLGTNAVVVTRVHCTELFCISLLKHMLWVFIRSALSRCFYEYQQHMFQRNNKKKYYVDTPYNLELSLLTILFLILEQVHDAFTLTLNPLYTE